MTSGTGNGRQEDQFSLKRSEEKDRHDHIGAHQQDDPYKPGKRKFQNGSEETDHRRHQLPLYSALGVNVQIIACLTVLVGTHRGVYHWTIVR